MQTWTILKFHLTPVRKSDINKTTNASKDAEKEEPFLLLMDMAN